jgi:hypothetical protein
MDDEKNAPFGANGIGLPYELGSGLSGEELAQRRAELEEERRALWGPIARNAQVDAWGETNRHDRMRARALELSLVGIPAGEWEDAEIVARAKAFLAFLKEEG